jgi:hypothetical protein
MLVAFGLAWPANIANSLRIKSSRTRSPVFLVIVISGYFLGMGAKLAGPGINYVFYFYLANTLMVSFDLFLYCRYRRLDRLRGGGL